MKIKCLAVDDEPLALQQINSYIDIFLFDINMTDINGMEFV